MKILKLKWFLVALVLVACGNNNDDKDNNRRPNQFNIPTAAHILNRYPPSSAMVWLEDFASIPFGGTIEQTEELLLAAGFVHDPRGSEHEDLGGGMRMRFWLGSYLNFNIEPAFFFNNNSLEQVIFNIEHQQKRAFLSSLAAEFGRPIFDEDTSNTYLWHFMNGYINYTDRPEYGLVIFAAGPIE
ncbi:MAG: hypothetical protein FWE37_04745 [Spirochaetaceae bacterium]|nr:hypothetical protein [Spirochaetaceae bacterium]